MKFQTFLLIAVLVVFTGYSATVIADQGYLGFMDVAMAGGWGTQVFLDLCIALVLFAIWMFPDAKERGLPAWPYFIAILFTGSIGALAYLTHRALKQPTPHPATA